MILDNFHENLTVFHVGTEPNRAFYIPCSKKVFFGELDFKTNSDRIQLLNGEWFFQLFESKEYVPTEIIRSDYWEKHREKIKVPSVWQYSGYDKHQYINLEYPIPFDPPYVPNDNPCGAYFKGFNITKQQLKNKCYNI